MAKMNWTRPVTEVQQFAANEYVAACGDTEYGAYVFECDADLKGSMAYFKDLFSWNGVTIWKIGSYSPCGKTHVVPKDNVFANGFIDANGNGAMDNGEEVIIWLEPGIFGTPFFGNGHATKNLDRESWEVVKS